MGRMTAEEAKQYQGNTSLFILEDDGDTAEIKVLIESMKDIYVYMVHYVKHEGRWKKIECRRSSLAEPEKNCPFCASGNKVVLKYFIPIWNFKEDMFQYWERGSTFKKKLTSMCENYFPVDDEVFVVERVGEKGNQDTKYEFECVTDDFLKRNPEIDIEFKFDDINPPDVFSAEANLVLIKTDEEIEYYLKNGKFEDDTFSYQDENSGSSYADRRSRRSEGNDSGDRNYQPRRGYSTRRNDDDDSSRGGSGYASRTNRRREF